MPAVPGADLLPVWLVPPVSAERQYFGAAPPLRLPAAANALLRVEQPLRTRNTPAGAQLRVYGPVLGNFLCFPGTESVLWDNPPVLSPSSPDRRACRQCPSGRRVPEKLLSPVRTMSARLRSHPDRVRHPPGSLATRRRLSDLPVLGRWQDTPRIAIARGHSHPPT